jgi:hypothetical protein
MIAPPSKRCAKALRTPFRYQNKPETTRFSDMAKDYADCIAAITAYLSELPTPFGIIRASA